MLGHIPNAGANASKRSIAYVLHGFESPGGMVKALRDPLKRLGTFYLFETNDVSVAELGSFYYDCHDRFGFQAGLKRPRGA